MESSPIKSNPLGDYFGEVLEPFESGFRKNLEFPEVASNLQNGGVAKTSSDVKRKLSQQSQFFFENGSHQSSTTDGPNEFEHPRFEFGSTQPKRKCADRHIVAKGADR